MSAKTYFKFLMAFFLAGVCLSFTGCGSSNNSSGSAAASQTVTTTTTPSTTTTSTSCPSGDYLIGGSCVYASSFQQACSYYGGELTTSSDSTQVCQTRIYSNQVLNGEWNGYVPELNPGDLPGQLSVNAGFSVMAGDKMLISTSSGGWGGSSCKQVYPTGYNTATSSVLQYNSQPEGLFISDSTSTYPMLQQGAFSFNFNYAGQVYYGFNVQPYQTGCSELSLVFSLDRCLDSSGNSHPCN